MTSLRKMFPWNTCRREDASIKKAPNEVSGYRFGLYPLTSLGVMYSSL